MPWRVVTHRVALDLSASAGFDLAWRQSPCRGESSCGDALLVELDRGDGGVLLLLIDATGHGEPAAQTADFVFDQLTQPSHPAQPALRDLAPPDLLTRLHARLQGHFLDTGRFVEALALLVKAPEGWLYGCRAGGIHTVWLWPATGPWSGWVVPGSAFLGIPHVDPYQGATHPLAQDEMLLAFSDGVGEAGRSGPAQFQHAALHSFLVGLPRLLTPPDLVARLWQAIQEHAPSNWNEDDVTAFALSTK